MKYKIISKRTIYRTKTAIQPFDALTPYSENFNDKKREQILLGALFEFATLPEVPKISRAQKFRARFEKLNEKTKQSQKRVVKFYTRILIGICGVASAIALICALVLFGRSIIPHTTLNIPSFVGCDVTELDNTDKYELIISYENHPELTEGTVISQSPPPGVERKLFRSNGACKIFLSVSAGKHFYEIPSLEGYSRRDALLVLKSEEIPVKIETQYSDTIESGHVIETVPSARQKLFDGEVLTLKISLGKAVRTVYVPSLFGLSETEASAAIRSAGLKLGKITYQSSDIAPGKVISQQYTPFSQLKSGGAIDITVSLGNSFTQKYIPDLYGSTVEEASEKLGKVGLVIGNIYAVSSGAPAGTVISQSILPSTPITSNITSVDIYVSS